jgi:hypothetical protein
MIGVMSDDDSTPKPPPLPAIALSSAARPFPVVATNTVEFRPRPETFRNLVQRLAADTVKIGWAKHAHERMAQRGISDKFALDALRFGVVKGAIDAGANPGEWKGKMTHRAKGRREVGVVVITVRHQRLFVKTVEWEDLS